MKIQPPEAFETVFTVDRPVIAAVNGHAIAGGCILAAACDRRLIVGGRARVGVPELNVGVPFPVSALEILRFAVGSPQAGRLVLGGATHSAQDAADIGLVDELVDDGDLLERAVASAADVAMRVPADTFQVTKRQLRRHVIDYLRRQRGDDDPVVTDLWVKRCTHGRIRSYMERVTGHR
ncbi:MAG: enoyl-CoA hydratase/isomerase family protein [Carbonactinosporaceae bacterium]